MKSSTRILEHYIATGEPTMSGMIVKDHADDPEIDPVGAWSDWAEPSQGWEPSKVALRNEIKRLRIELQAVGAALGFVQADLPTILREIDRRRDEERTAVETLALYCHEADPGRLSLSGVVELLVLDRLSQGCRCD